MASERVVQLDNRRVTFVFTPTACGFALLLYRDGPPFIHSAVTIILPFLMIQVIFRDVEWRGDQ